MRRLTAEIAANEVRAQEVAVKTRALVDMQQRYQAYLILGTYFYNKTYVVTHLNYTRDIFRLFVK